MVRCHRSRRRKQRYSPRIRGDGPAVAAAAVNADSFSPYSRGWSRSAWSPVFARAILPVFAGMVPRRAEKRLNEANSPRIRGDGPIHRYHKPLPLVFSPYSRGWSAATDQGRGRLRILPVFAGMVPNLPSASKALMHSPRIRGDGPSRIMSFPPRWSFSPYSRGWSRGFHEINSHCGILPVFAGMVRTGRRSAGRAVHSPRIRGDGPGSFWPGSTVLRFSPYSRGWSRARRFHTGLPHILPVFAGMVPMPCAASLPNKDSPRIRGDGPCYPAHIVFLDQFSPYSRGWSQHAAMQ